MFTNARGRIYRIFIAMTTWSALAAVAVAADPVPEAKPYADDGLSPAEALAHMSVPEGFQVDLIAAEPDLRQPVALAVDERGRLWVAEAYSYPTRRPDAEARDRILIFEDGDADGEFETRKVFADGLNLVSGLEVGFGGVWVGSAPFLLFIPDKDGDDVPDGEPEVLLDGWGYQDTHETLNSFIWGPDGWLYGCHGVFTHSKVGKPGAPDAERVPINAGFWRYHPTRHSFEVFAWGTSNPWGIDFDDHGQLFAEACVIPHFWHVIQGARYQRQGGQHFNSHVYEDIKTIADHRHWVGGTPHAGNRKSDTAGGGHAHCGFLIYLGDQFPERYRNRPMFFNVHGHRINQEVLTRDGSGYVAGHLPDLLLSNDYWFMGVALEAGPDGSVYFIDWYDQQNCHRREPGLWDRSNGRLYRLRFGTPEYAKIDLREETDAGLARLQSHRNEWFVRNARRLLQERAADGRADMEVVRGVLGEIFGNAGDVREKLRAVWAKWVTGSLPDGELVDLLGHQDEYVRAWAVQLLGERGGAGGVAAAALASRAADEPSPLVRLYYASLLQRLEAGRRWELAGALTSRGEDAGDHNIPLVLWYGIEPLVALDPARAMALAASGRIPKVSRFIARRAASDAAGLDAVVAAIGEADEAAAAVLLAEVRSAVEKHPDVPVPASWAGVYGRLRASGDAAVTNAARELAILFGDRSTFPDLRRSLADPRTPVDERVRVVKVLAGAKDTGAVATLQALLEEKELAVPAIRALARFDDARTPSVVLGVYRGLDPAAKREAIGLLTSRAGYAKALLEALGSGVVARGDVSAFAARQVAAFDDGALRAELDLVWGTVRESSPDHVTKEIATYRKRFSKENLQRANAQNGRAVYARTCGVCHALFGSGSNGVGPEITGANRGNLGYLLENIIDPGAVVGVDYRLNMVTTRGGQVVAGMVAGENDVTLTLRQVNGEELTLKKEDIGQRDVSQLSIMPAGQLATLGDDDARDLIAYLQAPAQVPLPGMGPFLDPATGVVDGAHEGESMVAVPGFEGSVSPQGMGSFTADRWSGGSQLWWTGGKPGDSLALRLDVAETGRYEIFGVFTKARDYGVFDLAVDGVACASVFDLFHPDAVLTTGAVSLGTHALEKGVHRFEATIKGKNPGAAPGFMFGLDYLWLRKTE